MLVTIDHRRMTITLRQFVPIDGAFRSLSVLKSAGGMDAGEFG